MNELVVQLTSHGFKAYQIWFDHSHARIEHELAGLNPAWLKPRIDYAINFDNGFQIFNTQGFCKPMLSTFIWCHVQGNVKLNMGYEGHVFEASMDGRFEQKNGLIPLKVRSLYIIHYSYCISIVG